MTTGYEIRVAGVIGPAARESLSHLTIEVDPSSGPRSTTTVVYGEMDADGLHEVLDRVRAFGLELVEIRHHPTRSGVDPSHVGPGSRPSPGTNDVPAAGETRE